MVTSCSDSESKTDINITCYCDSSEHYSNIPIEIMIEASGTLIYTSNIGMFIFIQSFMTKFECIRVGTKHVCFLL